MWNNLYTQLHCFPLILIYVPIYFIEHCLVFLAVYNFTFMHPFICGIACCCFCQTYAAEGRFTFSSHIAGEHTICLNSNSTAWLPTGQLVRVSTACPYGIFSPSCCRSIYDGVVLPLTLADWCQSYFSSCAWVSYFMSSW